ncbi:hypothetical protein ACG2F4_12205 [Halalkalibaculum sp. DA3122]|uniref:hypothetical protein n=1 Tax=unclassified Halalkalibaculum TaxID=2964617 RepID=UPI0037542718
MQSTKRPLSYALLILTINFAGCSGNLFDIHGENDDIAVEVTDNALLVQNRFLEPIYYFAVESNLSMLILWAPISSDSNRIDPLHTVKIEFNDVYGYAPGNRILFYHWHGEDPDQGEILSKTIDTG